MQRGLPVLVECNGWTLPQERFNTEWVKEKKVGVVLKSFDDVVSGLQEILEPAKLAEFKKNVGEQNNRAIFEIAEILERLLAGGNDSFLRSAATVNETVGVSSAD